MFKKSKRIIIDIGHPAQVHNFKHVYWDLEKKGWEILITAKHKEITKELLDLYDLNYRIIGKNKKGLFNKVLDFPLILYRYITLLYRYKPEVIIHRFSAHAAWGGWLMRVPTIGLADTEHTKLLDYLTVPLTSAKMTSYSYKKDLGKNHFRFKGTIEMFYLHPNRYQFNPNNVDYKFNIKKTALIRFISWDAHHDKGEKGFSLSQKRELIKLLLSYSITPVISSEGLLDEEFRKFELKLSPDKIHDYIRSCDLYIGEGASMALEASLLGVPSFYVNSLNAGVLELLSEKKLLKSFRSTNDFFKDIYIDISNNLVWYDKKNLNKHISEQIDSTALLTWFIENYPKSIKIMTENPSYQNNFK